MTRPLFFSRRALQLLLGSLLLLAIASCSRSTYAPESPPTSVYAEADQAPDLDAEELERQVHARVNEERRDRGLLPLAWNDTLATMAQAHSENMAREDFFAHVDPAGNAPTDRARQHDFSCSEAYSGSPRTGLGENLYNTYQYRSYKTSYEDGRQQRTYNWKTQAQLVREIVDGWLESPRHRQNLLSPRFEAEGIGIHITGDEQLFVTQDLC